MSNRDKMLAFRSPAMGDQGITFAAHRKPAVFRQLEMCSLGWHADCGFALRALMRSVGPATCALAVCLCGYAGRQATGGSSAALAFSRQLMFHHSLNTTPATCKGVWNRRSIRLPSPRCAGPSSRRYRRSRRRRCGSRASARPVRAGPSTARCASGRRGSGPRRASGRTTPWRASAPRFRRCCPR